MVFTRLIISASPATANLPELLTHHNIDSRQRLGAVCTGVTESNQILMLHIVDMVLIKERLHSVYPDHIL